MNIYIELQRVDTNKDIACEFCSCKKDSDTSPFLVIYTDAFPVEMYCDLLQGDEYFIDEFKNIFEAKNYGYVRRMGKLHDYDTNNEFEPLYFFYMCSVCFGEYSFFEKIDPTTIIRVSKV